ncbi:polygalacturonase-like [Euphorbia lathyris]|uniref:polygalacturonase-like n=1 Tax=Euphorbia lathyris TaxID=212925 RepID=UPI003314041B
MAFKIAIILIFIIYISSSSSAIISHNVISYGAKPDGITDSTEAFLAAWKQACSSINPVTIHVPPGKFLLRNLVFSGNCKNNAILLLIDGTLVAPSDYRVIGYADDWISFRYVNGVSLVGGLLDAQGTSLWNCKATSKNCPSGATSLRFTNSKNIEITGLTSINSQMFHIDINGCNNVKMDNVKVIAPAGSPNTDGIHVQLSSDVTIFNSEIRTGDDCISIGPGTFHLWIQNIGCGPGHGISIGSLAKDFNEAGVQNVTIKNVRFTGTENGVRIKSWARPTTGFATNILFEGVSMTDVHNPILIDQHYCPHEKDCPRQGFGVKISDVSYQDIYGTSATQVAVKFDCNQNNPCTGIRMDNVYLTYKNQPANASCSNATGTSSGSNQPASCL